MAVTSVNEMAVPSPLTLGRESNTYTRMYKVLVTVGGMQGAIEAATATGVPKVGDALVEAKSFGTTGNTGYCESVSPVLQAPESDYFHYIVTCTFTQNGSGGGSGGSTDNSEAYTLSYSYDKSEVIAWDAADPADDFIPGEFGGDRVGILNSAGDPFSEPLRISIPVLTINIQDTKSEFDPKQSQNFLHTVNKDQITIAGVSYSAKSLMLTEFSAERAMQNGLIVWNRSIKLTASAPPFTNDFKIKVLDQGFNYLIEDTEEFVPEEFRSVNPDRKRPFKVGKNKDKPSTPQLLDGSGGILGDGAKPKFLEFEIFPSTDFQLLNIPSLEGTVTP